MDPVLFPIDSSPYSSETYDAFLARKTERENQIAGLEPLPVEEMSEDEIYIYENYLNEALNAIDRLRHPGELPMLPALKQQGAPQNQGEGAPQNHGQGTPRNQVEPGGGHQEGPDPSQHSQSSDHERSDHHAGEHGGATSAFIDTVHAAEFTHTAIENTAEALGHSGGHTPHATGSVTTPAQTTVPAVETPPASTTPVPAQTTSSPAPTPPETPSVPLREPITPEMQDYVDNVRRAMEREGIPPARTVTPEAPAAAPRTGTAGTTTATTETPSVPLREPITPEMQDYVDNVRRAMERESMTSVRSGTATPEATTTTPQGGTGNTGTTVTEGAARAAASETEAAEAANAAEQGAHGSRFHSAMRHANKVLGPLAVVAGGLEAAHGIEELQEGKTVEGALDVTGGAAGVTSGAALTVTGLHINNLSRGREPWRSSSRSRWRCGCR